MRLKLTQRFAPLTSLLADRAGMIMSPKALDELGEKFSSKPVCVGPFKFKERVASDRIVLERAADYYDADRVSLRELTFKIITEGPVRASNLRSGDVDLAERLEPIDVVSIKGDDSIQLHGADLDRLPGPRRSTSATATASASRSSRATRRWRRTRGCARRSSCRWTAR